MKLLKSTLYFIIVLLILQVIKLFLSKQQFESSYFITLILNCVQFLLFLGIIFIFFFEKVSKKYFHFRKPFLAGIYYGGILFLLAELLFGYMLYHPDKIPSFLMYSYQYYYDYFKVDLIQFDKEKARYDKDLFYTLNPNKSFEFNNIEFQDHFFINGNGWRDSESSLISPEIICLGDSYTMGWGVGQEECFPKKLEKLSALKVLNTGVASYGTAREIASLDRVDTSKLKYIVIQYCSNDEGENSSCIENNFKLKVSAQSVYNDAVKSQIWTRKYFPGKYFLTILEIFFKKAINHLYPFFNLQLERNDKMGDEQKQAQYFTDILYHSKINFSKIKVIITMMDTYPHLKNQFLNNVKDLLFKEKYQNRFFNNVVIVDISQILKKDDYYILDAHFKQSGHEKIAELIWKKIKEQ